MHARGAKNVPCSVPAPSGGGLDQLRFLVHACGVIVEDLLGVLVDDRADVGRQQARLADLQFVHRACEHRDDLVGDVFLHEQDAAQEQRWPAE